MKRRIIASITLLVAVFSCISAVSFKVDDIKSESRMELGYSIINGYSKLSVKNGLKSYEKTAVFSAPNLSNPYIIALTGAYYLANGVDLDRLVKDNDYAYSMAEGLNGFFGTMLVSNDRAEKLKQRLKKDEIKIIKAFDAVGLFIVKTDADAAEKLMNDENVDFVFAGGEVPSTMRDLNLDGKTDYLDALLIQSYLADCLKPDDREELEYIKFACDVNGDKKLNINDATAAQMK